MRRHRDGNPPLSTGTRQQAFHLLIVIAVETLTGTQAFRHTLGEKAIALNPVDTKALKLAVGTQETQAIAIGKAGGACHCERVAPQLLDSADKLAHRLRRIKRGDVGLTAMQEIGGIAPIEGLRQIGREGSDGTRPWNCGGNGQDNGG